MRIFPKCTRYPAASIAIGMLLFLGCSDEESAALPGSTVDPPQVEQEVIPGISLAPVAEGLVAPVHIAQAGDGSGRLFIVEQQGIVRIVKNGQVIQEPFLDIAGRVKAGGEQGLLSIVFPPGYPVRNYFYANYTEAGSGDTVIARFRTSADPDRADPASEQRLLTIPQPYANHNGGQMAFGPDGLLYIGTGDGGGAGDPRENGQNTGVLLGKILRLDVESGAEYSIPPSNPFVDQAGARPEIWALGLRNPWRFSFDRGTGDLYIADVGQSDFEEVNRQPASSSGGENYGWDIMEGSHCFNAASCDKQGLTLPILDYARRDGNCSITGGFVYRGAEFPRLEGVYVYGDYCSGRIWGARMTGQALENKLLLDSDLAISSFGEDEAGSLYVLDHHQGSVYKIIAE